MAKHIYFNIPLETHKESNTCTYPYPIIRHKALASSSPTLSSHIVPQVSNTFISTLPSVLFPSPISRVSCIESGYATAEFYLLNVLLIPIECCLFFA